MTIPESDADRTSLEERTNAFFGRRASEVVTDFANKIVRKGKTESSPNKGKIIEIERDGKVSFWTVEVAEDYSGDSPGKPWAGKRHSEIFNMQTAEVVAYPSRGKGTTLSFVKTVDADNIQLHRLRNIETGEIAINSTHVSQVMGLSPYQRGKLVLTQTGNFRFVKH